MKKASSIGGNDDGARDALLLPPLQLPEFSVASAPSWPLRDASCHRQWILSSLARALAGRECGSSAGVRPRRRRGGCDSIDSLLF